MYKRTPERKRSIRRPLAVCLAAVAFCLLLGCQKTPGNDVVVNKLGSDAYDAEGEGQPYDAPETWTERIENGNVTYSIEAAIEVPDVTQYPIIEVEPAYFDCDVLDRIIYQLVPDADIRVEDIRIWTKAQYQQFEIDIILAAIEKVDINHPELSKEEKAAYLKDREAELENAIAMYNATPEQRDFVQITSLLQMGDQVPFCGTATAYDKNGKSAVEISLSNPKDAAIGAGFKAYLRAGSYDVEKRAFVETNRMRYPILDLDNTRVAAVTSEFIQLVGLDESYQLNGIYQEMGYGEAGVFVRSYEGIPATYALADSVYPEPDYVPTWSGECLMVYVDASYNVCQIQWRNPCRTNNTLNQNPSLLPFVEVQDIIRTNLRYFEPSLTYDDNMLHRTVVIDCISLGMMRVKRVQSTEDYVLLPVWDCFCHYVDHYVSQEKSEFVLDSNNNVTTYENNGVGVVFTINAIDGSVIDRHLGY